MAQYKSEIVLVENGEPSEIIDTRDLAHIPEVGNQAVERGARYCEVQSVEDLRDDDSTELDLIVAVERIEPPEPAER